jgi:hypothetical protein
MLARRGRASGLRGASPDRVDLDDDSRSGALDGQRGGGPSGVGAGVAAQPGAILAVQQPNLRPAIRDVRGEPEPRGDAQG